MLGISITLISTTTEIFFPAMAIFKSYFSGESSMSAVKKQQSPSRAGSGEKNCYVTIFGWLVFLISYGFLIPGLILPLYYYKVMGIREEKTMMGTIKMLRDDGGVFAAALLSFFGIAVPVIKLLLVAYGHWKNAAWASRFVVWISKWAIVDAVIASFIMAYYANALKGSVISKVEVGFIFFVLYCTLSTAAALILDDRDVEFRDIYASQKLLKDNRWLVKKSSAIYTLSAAFGLSITSMILYTVRMGIKPELVSMSVFSACNRLLTEVNADPRPMVIILLFVVIVPIVEFIFMAYMVYRPTDNFYTRCALRCLPQCGLLDVYAVSIVVMDIMINALGSMTIAIAALGFTLLCVSVGATVFARFVLGRYLANLFGGAESTKPLERVDREQSNAVTDSERVVAIAV
jgi:uncharacterized paraquat-inducible protein A